MQKISLVILSFTLFGCVFSQDCNNPLLAAYNLTALDQPQSGEGLPWCSNLQGGQTCCSSDTVNQFQTLIQDLINALESEAGERDQGLVGLRNDLINPYQDAVSDLTDNDDQLRDITNANAAVGNEIRAQWDQFKRTSDQLSDLDDDTDTDDDFLAYLQNLQFARRTCLSTVLDVQASLWCLACDPNYASQGVNPDGTLVISDATANSIKDNCYGYLLWSQALSPVLYANQTIQRVRDLNDYLRNYGRDNSVLQNANVSNDVYQPVEPNEKTVSLPPDCSNTNCSYQALLLFSDASVNQDIAANGAGLLGGADAILADIVQGNVVPSTLVPVTVDDLLRNGTVTAVLQNGGEGAYFNPPGNWSGLAPTVVGDPAQVSGFQENVLPPGVNGKAAGSWEGAQDLMNGNGDVNYRSDSSDTDD